MNRKIARSLSAVLLAILISLFVGGSALAASCKITTSDTTHYFQSYANHRWSDLKTPKHTMTASGKSYLAYCLQHKKSTPKGTSYTLTDVMDGYSDKARNGLYAIVYNGYPFNSNGLSANKAFYATANAIRCWLAECGDSQHYNMSKLSSFNASTLRSQAASGTIKNHLRVKDAANIPMLQFLVELLIKARNQETLSHEIGISARELEMQHEGGCFSGKTSVTITNLRGGYKIDASGLPTGSSITGYTGTANDTLTISIPADAAYAGKEYAIALTGYDDRVPGNVQAYDAGNTTYQRMMGVFPGAMQEVCSATITLKTNALPQPDLTITSMEPDKESYAGGEKMTVTATILNQGEQDAEAFETSLKLEGSSTKQASTKGLAAGETAALTFEFSAPVQTSATMLDVYAFVDCTTVIDESNEWNNDEIARVNIRAAQPDLVITSLKTDKSAYDAGDAITVTLVVKNQGNNAAGAFEVSLASDLEEQKKSVSGLDAGASKTLKYTYTAPRETNARTIRFDAFADCGYAVQESNENNNTASTSATINAGLPDLTIRITPNLGTAKPGETVIFAVVVENRGDQDVRGTDVDVAVDGNLIGSQTVGGIPAGSSITLTFEYTIPEDASLDSLYAEAIVDPDNQIPEQNEDNNRAHTTVGIEDVPPDLSVVDTNAQSWYGGKDVVVTATIRNHSQKGVPDVAVQLNFCGQTWEDRICVPGNGDNLAVFRITAPDGTGEASASFIVDPGNEVQELDETNNVLSRTVELVNPSRGVVLDPDDADMEQAYQQNPVRFPSPDDSDVHRWQEYRYESGSYVLRDYWAKLEISAALSPDARVAYEGDAKLMESGFGVSISVASVLSTNYDHAEKLVGVQNIWCWSPESGYGQFSNYSDVFDNLDVESGNRGDPETRWQYAANPHSETQSRLHYTPLWFPDGEYRILIEAIYGWTPAGQLHMHTSDAVNIDGDMYDRVTAVE